MMPHNPLGPICTAATVHFSAAVANFSWLETRTSTAEQLGFDNSEFFPVQPRIEKAHYAVSDAAGLGIEVEPPPSGSDTAPHLLAVVPLTP